MSRKFERSGSVPDDQVPVLSLVRNERTEDLRNLFAAQYKREPDFYVRVPGRVNLIGEHIDYCGYGVCPMALQQDILVAVGANSNHELRLSNVDKQYEDFNCDIRNFTIDVSTAAGGPRWYKYFLCGVQGIAELMKTKGRSLDGMDVAVNGNIPQSAGLSSSSALVSAAALATAYLHQALYIAIEVVGASLTVLNMVSDWLKFAISKENLASVSAECEKYIGTQGGGMDQAIAFLASEGCAKLIEFSPLRSQDVILPRGAVFVIAHSLARLNKAATADFNCRVIECRLASQILAKKHGLLWQTLQRLGDLQKALEFDLEVMCDTVAEHLHVEPYTKAEVCEVLQVNPEELDEVSLTPNTRHILQFRLHQRASHVFQEALRVRQFHAQCVAAAGADDADSTDEEDENALAALGDLMAASHASLRDLYECSHPKLDQLVELSKGITYGMRLTGAGWGGCAVALVAPANVDKFISTIKEKFYQKASLNEGGGEQGDNLVFATSPNTGASVHVASQTDFGNGDSQAKIS